jgi:hypothetical protein
VRAFCTALSSAVAAATPFPVSRFGTVGAPVNGEQSRHRVRTAHFRQRTVTSRSAETTQADIKRYADRG